MYIAKFITTAAVAAALTAAACDRGRQADETAQPDMTAAEQQRQQEEANRLEQRVTELEREWNEARQNVSAQAGEAREEVESGLRSLREEVSELRTTNAENWWDRHERDMEEAANELEQDVRRFARNWNPREAEEVGTTGDTTTWEGRRDRLLARMEARIEQMEEALTSNDTRQADPEEIEETRTRVRELRADADRLRNASEDDWWEVTRDRVNNYIERVEAAIRRLDDDNAERPRS